MIAHPRREHISAHTAEFHDGCDSLNLKYNSKARFPFKRNRLCCVRCVNENRKKRNEGPTSNGREGQRGCFVSTGLGRHLPTLVRPLNYRQSNAFSTRLDVTHNLLWFRPVLSPCALLKSTVRVLRCFWCVYRTETLHSELYNFSRLRAALCFVEQIYLFIYLFIYWI